MRPPFRLRTLHVLLGGLLTLSLLGACDKKSSEEDDSDSQPRKRKRKRKRKAKKPVDAEEGSAAAFFLGEPPSGVVLGSRKVASDHVYAISYPSTWRNGGVRNYSYMTMRHDSSAAIFCNGTGLGDFHPQHRVGQRELNVLFKRAPARGRDMLHVGEPVKLDEVSKHKYSARVGKVKGVFFYTQSVGYWIDIRYAGDLYDKTVARHVYCVATYKKDVGENVINEVKAIMRSIEPPKGKILEPVMKDEDYGKLPKKTVGGDDKPSDVLGDMF